MEAKDPVHDAFLSEDHDIRGEMARGAAPATCSAAPRPKYFVRDPWYLSATLPPHAALQTLL